MKNLEQRAAEFKAAIDSFSYPDTLKTDFYEYWSEPNKSGTKMLYELEKTWDLTRRLRRWADNGFKKYSQEKPQNALKFDIMKEPTNDLERLDQMLNQYKEKFDRFKLEEFGQWYDYMKAEKLFKVFSKEDIQILRDAYEDDNAKCRAACVKWTFDALINMKINFNWIKQNQIK